MTTEPDGPQLSDAELAARRAVLDRKLGERRARDVPESSRPRPGMAAMAQGMKIASEFVAGIAVGALLGLACARTLNALALGDDLARGLGRHVLRDRLVVGVATVLLAGASVALAGPIAFVGLVAPHLARAVAGPDHRWIHAFSALFAALLLLGADVVGRVIVAPSEVAAGIVTALIGGPFFIATVRRFRESRP